MIFNLEENFNQDCEKTFIEEINNLLNTALDISYSSASEKHDPEQGANNNTFGTDIYHFSCFELTKIAEASEGRIKIISTFPVFRLKVGQFEIANHKVGNSELDDIKYSFPNTHRAACAKREYFNPNQLPIDFPKDTENTVKNTETHVPYNLVLAHMGNHVLGLCAVYLCRPGRVENDKIKEWEFTKQLWKRSENITIPNPLEFERPVDEETPKPKVVKRPKDEEIPKPNVEKIKKDKLEDG
jgi:hypothetical protein